MNILPKVNGGTIEQFHCLSEKLLSSWLNEGDNSINNSLWDFCEE